MPSLAPSTAARSQPIVEPNAACVDVETTSWTRKCPCARHDSGYEKPCGTAYWTCCVSISNTGGVVYPERERPEPPSLCLISCPASLAASRCAALSQSGWPREPVVLHGARSEGEPQRACGRCRVYATRTVEREAAAGHVSSAGLPHQPQATISPPSLKTCVSASDAACHHQWHGHKHGVVRATGMAAPAAPAAAISQILRRWIRGCQDLTMRLSPLRPGSPPALRGCLHLERDFQVNEPTACIVWVFSFSSSVAGSRSAISDRTANGTATSTDHASTRGISPPPVWTSALCADRGGRLARV